MPQPYSSIKRKGIQLLLACASVVILTPANAQQSVAREWNEALLQCIRKDLARPTIHARNIFHITASMYDAWAVYDSTASTYLLGKNIGPFICAFNGIPTPADKVAAQEEAMSYAAYRMIRARFQNSPGAAISLPPLDALMLSMGYPTDNFSQDYSTGSAAALGNYIAACYINYGLTDGANQAGNYANQYYQPANPPIYANHNGDTTMLDPNRWQQIFLDQYIDQNGNVYNTTPPFLSAEWGNVQPFALTDANKTVHTRNGHNYNVYLDAGAPPLIDTNQVEGMSSDYKTGYLMVSIWQAQLDTADHVMWDISPASIGNIPSNAYPTTYTAGSNFYNYTDGGDMGEGRTLNPKTGQPYAPNIVHRGDYARVLAEFWADGPNSETPPGHWFTILNYVADHPQFEKRYEGQGEILSDLEWDIRSYFSLAGAMHDAAITAWSNKGWYDSPRPISVLRWMCGKGQSSDPQLPSFHPAGTPLIPGYVELVLPGDPLAGANNEHLNKIKLYTWRGHAYIPDPTVDMAGAGWILAENWWPYQRSSFVTPPFAGYVSGHSTYSRTAAEVMTMLTGDNFFPGGMCEFHATQNQYLVFEEGPSEDITLQWATYQDASDQCSLSRIYGGIHPPQDDLPGRNMGMFLGPNAFNHAKSIINAGLPYVNSVSINSPVISDQNLVTNVVFTITYNEAMQVQSIPVIEFENSAAAASLTYSNRTWVNATTCELTYALTDLNTNVALGGVKVSGAKDVTGNDQKIYFQHDLFAMDTRNPVLTAYTVNLDSVSMVNVGTGTFNIAFEFDEAMNTNTAPLVSFAPSSNEDVFVLNTSMSAWANDTTYLAFFNVMGNTGVASNTFLSYALAYDVAGNDMGSVENTDPVFVDTRQPQVAILASNTYTLYPENVGIGAIEFVSIYSEEMNPNYVPVIDFPGNATAASLLQFEAANSGWINPQTYRAIYSLSFQSIDIDDIDVNVLGGRDIIGNTQLLFNKSNYFSILMDTSSVGITDVPLKNESIHVFPNPVTSGTLVSIKHPSNTASLQLRMFAMNGQLVKSEQALSASNGTLLLSTLGLRAGIYFIQLSDEHQSFSFKLSVQE